MIEYIRTGNVTDSFTKELENEVVLLNDDTDWRTRHMTFEMKLEQRYDMGYEDGLRQGTEIGVKQGFEQGIEQGIKQTTKSIIRSMLEQQFSPEVIMKITGCAKKKIENARKTN